MFFRTVISVAALPMGGVSQLSRYSNSDKSSQAPYVFTRDYLQQLTVMATSCPAAPANVQEICTHMYKHTSKSYSLQFKLKYLSCKQSTQQTTQHRSLAKVCQQRLLLSN